MEEPKIPMGVSQWKKHGIKYGYWKYFEEEIKSERDRYWVTMLHEHQQHCTQQGRKDMTKVKKLIWGKHRFPAKKNI